MKSTYEKVIFNPMFIATQVTVAKIGNQSRCPSTDDLIKKMWYVRTVGYYSALAK